LHGKKSGDGLWHLSVINDQHNHEPSNDMSGHPLARRLNAEERTRVQQMSAAGIRPRQILSTLRQDNSSLSAVARTVYNARSQLRQEYLGGRTPSQALLDILRQTDFMLEYMHDDNGRITHLFFAHPTSVQMMKNWNSVLLMDCTYKTNKFKMPLLNVVGVTSFNTTFFGCFAFIKSEREEDYEWAMNCVARIFTDVPKPGVIVTDRELALMRAINSVFPNARNLLCIWHIEKNVLSNCRRYFSSDENHTAFLKDWTHLIKAKAESDFVEGWSELS
jgi:hypothetical protein